MWGGWGIYSPNHQKWPLGGCLSHGAPDSLVRHRTLSGAPATLAGRWVLTVTTTAKPVPRQRPGPTCHVTGATVTTCKETASPLAPMSCLLDCETSAATRGSPARDPTVPIECNDHGSVSRGRRRDGRYGRKRTSSNCSNRRVEAVVQSPTGSHPLLKW
jgi:hypothetical protein